MSSSASYLSCGSELPVKKEEEMRIVETAAAGVIAIATQILVVAAVLL